MSSTDIDSSKDADILGITWSPACIDSMRLAKNTAGPLDVEVANVLVAANAVTRLLRCRRGFASV